MHKQKHGTEETRNQKRFVHQLSLSLRLEERRELRHAARVRLLQLRNPRTRLRSSLSLLVPTTLLRGLALASFGFAHLTCSERGGFILESFEVCV